MSELSKQALKVENNQSFPNNNAGLITPSALRTFNEDMIDSTVNQDVYTTDSASFDSRINAITGSGGTTDTGSLLTTASAVDNVMTFTKGDGSQFNVTVGSVLPSGLVSGSSQIILQDTTGNLSGSRIDGLVLSSSYAISSSHSEFADDATNSTFSVYADNTIVYGKNLEGAPIIKGSPLYFTGSGTSGNLVGIYYADAGNPSRMPAGGVAGETIAVGEEGIILLDGFISGVDTTAFAPGDEVFVGVGGGYTNVVPTGSNNLIQFLGYVEKSDVNGSGVIQMTGEARSLPNLQSGYAWVGDVNDVPQQIPTSSFGGGTIDTGSFATTGSNTFTSQQIINSNDGIILRTNDGTSTGEVRITPGTNPPTKFTESELIGIATIGTNKISGSWGGIGQGPGGLGSGGVVGIYNHETASLARTVIRTSILGSPAPNGQTESGYDALGISPSTSLSESQFNIKGTRVTISASSGSKQTSVTVSGDITASNINISNDLIVDGSLTASLQQGYVWVGDSAGRTTTVPTSSFGTTIDTGSFATTGSNTFDGTQTVKGDVIISASASEPNHLFIQRSTTGAQQYLRLGPDDNQNNFQFIVTGSDQNPGQPVWAINVQGGQWQNGFDAPTGFSNFTNFRSGIDVRFGGGQPTARMGVNHISESVQIYTGLSSDGHYIVSSSVDERILEINPTTATVAIGNTISSQIFLNPQILTGTQTVPSGFNGMITGPVSNGGTIVIESGSTLVII